ncbi:hypothetical protein HGA64_04400 [Candidatus Falkowbacteria bacterium]|nr:hypothetical protein [Candidatus Falkowbacteria bacterium]
MKLFEQLLGEAVTVKQDVESEDGVLVASTHHGREIAIRIFYKDISKYPNNLFKITLINTPNVGESQVSSLRFAGDNTNTCGYVFPITSLRTGNFLPEGKWPSVYAAAATRELLETNILAPFVIENSLVKDEVEITDILPESLGVLVIGCEQLKQASTSIDAVELMLMEYGYLPFSDIFLSKKILNSNPYESRISIRNLASRLADDVFGLKWLMSSVFVQQTNLGRFLTLYQVLECVLAIVFGKAMEKIIADNRSKTDPWWVSAKVHEVEKENWRLNFIQQHCLKTGISHAAFNDNRQACEQLLVALNLRTPNMKALSWAGTLYRTRNIFVHNQKILREIDEIYIDSVCETLQNVCFEVMAGYSDPSSNFLKEESA